MKIWKFTLLHGNALYLKELQSSQPSKFAVLCYLRFPDYFILNRKPYLQGFDSVIRNRRDYLQISCELLHPFDTIILFIHWTYEPHIGPKKYQKHVLSYNFITILQVLRTIYTKLKFLQVSFRKLMKRHQIRIFIHSIYEINFQSPFSTFI